jgi:hypothetical protein
VNKFVHPNLALFLEDSAVAKSQPSDAQLWGKIIDLLNEGNEDRDSSAMYGAAEDLILSMEGGSPLPSNCVIRPGLTRQGFIHLLYLIRAAVDH